ncbi:dihydroorotase [Bradyrhizobium canariense]|uniref:Allantoinase n=1 Tax=Bradyrhizobium canariense TaxID=255045 RepID=A0A1H1YQA8_9BRAD|nr:amidohydrolase family protein [Bradyrhizobium canariense]SDT23665.1 allantoinase [Bradyrhizobium canariense]
MVSNSFDRVIIGDVVLKDRVVEDAYVGISGGIIKAIGHGGPPNSIATDDYSGCLLFPGLVDAQVHSGSHEGYTGLADATRAAAAGGVTTIVDMPFDNPLPVDSVARFRQKVDAVHSLAIVDVGLYVTPPKSKDYAWVAELKSLGACAIKISTYEYHPVRFPRTRTGEMIGLFNAAASADLPVSFHNEDQDIVEFYVNQAKERGETGIEAHWLTRPPIAELVADAQVLELASHTDVRCHIVHSSLESGCTIASEYKKRGNAVTVETCIHYLTLNQDDMKTRGAFLKINPPLRSETDRIELWKSVTRGDIDMISTDHVGWPASRKQDSDIFKNGSGAPGLEGFLPALYTEAVSKRSFCPTLIAKLASENPARHFGFYPRKGSIAIGADADIAVFKKGNNIFDPARLASKIKWSPYDGRAMAGRVEATYLRGDRIYGQNTITAKQGYGRFLAPLS